MRRMILIVAVCFVQITTIFAQSPDAEYAKFKNKEFDADWAELNKREIPSWFNEAKFGIFVVWGPYSVPAWTSLGYAEWYWNKLVTRKLQDEIDFHKRVYGDKSYEQITEEGFTAELFDADQWCDLFKRSGAKYVITTANYHDGFAMYPTEYSKTSTTDKWNSMEIGPKRDIIGELNDAGDRVGLKMGIYYSLYEWYHPLWMSDRKRFATEWMQPKFKECVERYKPWSIFFDGEWAMDGVSWQSNELAKWLYQESSVKDKVVVNDRWGSSRGKNGDVFESEYGAARWTTPEHPWQEDRGIGMSYGYNRNESVEDYDSSEEVIRTLSSVAGGGGNLLLCVGPAADGRIPVIMQERLVDIGAWLERNGDAIYGTSATPFYPRTFDWGAITSKGNKLYLQVHNPDTDKIFIGGFNHNVLSATMVVDGEAQPIKCRVKKGDLELEWSKHNNDAAVTVLTLELGEAMAEYDCRQYQNGDGELFIAGRAFEFVDNEAKPFYNGAFSDFKMTGWSEAEGYGEAEVVVSKPGRYQVDVTYMCDAVEKEGSDVEFTIGDTKLSHKTKTLPIDLTRPARPYVPVTIGEVEFSKDGDYTIRIEPKKGGEWGGFGFQSIHLTPIE